MKIRYEDLLNTEQLKAVKSRDGPILVLAGAGSGKTRVITHRIAYLLESGVAPSNILAVTFTNKAAKEMQIRVKSLTGVPLRRLTVCTFHSFGVKVLRESIDRLGFRNSFTIYDQTDREGLIREVAHECGIPTGSIDLRAVSSRFSAAKTDRDDATVMDDQHKRLFDEYQSHLRLYNAVDFDDLIVLPVALFEEDSEVLRSYQERYRYVLVDEFQDTSIVQYKFMKMLASGSRNICVVGDDDQSIYSWRGASYENLERFERDFPERIEIKLERNYRSSGNILRAANAVIAMNSGRKPKALWTGAGDGEPIRLSVLETESDEADFIAETIRRIVLDENLRFHDFGVLVRTNNLTRHIEEAFLSDNLPYEVSGGMSFFQRKEVKDILGYLKVIANPDDDVNFLRIINTPRRGIGKKAIEEIVAIARRLSCSLYSATAALSAADNSSVSGKVKSILGEFHELIESSREGFLTGKGLSGQLEALIEDVDYWGYLVGEFKKPDTAKWKYLNVGGLVSSLAAYEQDEDNLDVSLFGYLNRISLLTRDDDQAAGERGKVHLMTIHAAKGLEFHTVFVAGVESGVMPHLRALADGLEADGEDTARLEEERRLFYVALTRAKRNAFLTSARTRRRRGKPVETGLSPFIDEIPEGLLEVSEVEDSMDGGDMKRLWDRVKSYRDGES